MRSERSTGSTRRAARAGHRDRPARPPVLASRISVRRDHFRNSVLEGPRMAEPLPITGSQNAYWVAAARHFLSQDAEGQQSRLERMTPINRATILATIKQLSAVSAGEPSTADPQL